MTEFNLQNLDLLSVGIAIAAIGIIGFAVFYNDKEKPTNKVFLSMSLMAIFWSIFNYLSYLPSDKNVAIWLLRLAIFFAVWFSYYIYSLFYTFPRESVGFPQNYRNLLITLTWLTSFINLTPLVFKEVTSLSGGRVSTVTNGPAIFLFGLTIILLIVCGIVLLVKKIKTLPKNERLQVTTVLLGISTTSVLLIIFNFIFPAFLNIPRFVPLGAVFLFPFIAFTSYAILKQKLFNAKVITTEVMTFIIAIVSLIEVVIAKELELIIFRIITFILVLIFGFLLIKSVRKEIEQKERLQNLTNELAKANEKLKALDQARAEFISIASHQLRTPPATMKWYLASILAGDFGELNSELKDALAKTETTNNGLIALIEDLLNVSRIERGKMEFFFQPVNITELMQLTFDQLIPQAKEKRLKFVFKKPKKALPEITADREKLRQVINNLLDNAIKYTHQGSVTLEPTFDGKDIVIKVTDTGKGVTSEDRKQIFQKFSRGKDSHHHSMGLGLGLYVAKIIIQQHGGKIWVDSEGEGKGSSFCVSLPLKNNLKATTMLDLTQEQKKMV